MPSIHVSPRIAFPRPSPPRVPVRLRILSYPARVSASELSRRIVVTPLSRDAHNRSLAIVMPTRSPARALAESCSVSSFRVTAAGVNPMHERTHSPRSRREANSSLPRLFAASYSDASPCSVSQRSHCLRSRPSTPMAVFATSPAPEAANDSAAAASARRSSAEGSVSDAV